MGLIYVMDNCPHCRRACTSGPYPDFACPYCGGNVTDPMPDPWEGLKRTIARILWGKLEARVISTIGFGIPSQTDYRDRWGRLVGRNLMGMWSMEYPYQGQDWVDVKGVHVLTKKRTYLWKPCSTQR